MSSPPLRGSPHACGAAHLYYFPFDIFVTEHLSRHWVQVDGAEVCLYPPFLVVEPEVDSAYKLSAVPQREGAAPVDVGPVGIKRVRATYSSLGERRNALRLDIVPDTGAVFARELGERLVGLIRWYTMQWWVGRDSLYSEIQPQASFPINEFGERLGMPSRLVQVYGSFGIEQSLDDAKFAAVGRRLRDGQFIPLAYDALFDAVYYRVRLEFRRAVMFAAIACQAKIVEETMRRASATGCSKSQIDRALGSSDFTVQLTKGVTTLLGRDFRRELPHEYEVLRGLRTARGNVAHGGDAMIAQAGGSRRASEYDVTRMLAATRELFKWLESLPAPFA